MAKDKTKRKLIAVVHADVKGYSRLMSEDDEYTVRTLAANRQEMYRLAESHDGQVVDTAGDGFLIEFPSVVDAVKFSVEFQREMNKRNADIPDDRKMEFRIGVNIGDVIHDGATIHGDGVNVAARLEGIADPGGICISGTAYDQVENRLELDYEYLGDKSVKNIAKPVRTYKVLMDSDGTVKPKEKQKTTKPNQRSTTYFVAAIFVMVAAVSIGAYYFYFHSPESPTKTALVEAPALPLPDKPSIAVLPFDNMSGDPKQEYFNNGITEEIISSLSRIPKLFVIARHSTFAFKGQAVTVQEVGRKLGVRYVLEGSVRREGERVRITVQLIDAQTGGHVWAKRYDRELKSIFELQDDITRKVMVAMQVKLTEGEQARAFAGTSRTEDLATYEKRLQAREYVLRMTKEANAKGQKLMEEIIATEPSNFKTLGNLAFSYILDAMFGWSNDRQESGRKAFQLAKKAIALDDSYFLPHCVLAYPYVYSRQYDRAIAEVQRAVELNPGSSEAHAHLATILSWVDRPQEALKAVEKTLRLNPMPFAPNYFVLGNIYRKLNQYDKSVAAYKKGLQIQPDHGGCLFGLAITYSMAGLNEKARETSTELRKLNPNISLVETVKRLPSKNQANRARVVEALRKAGLK